jgi:hypothetical protein
MPQGVWALLIFRALLEQHDQTVQTGKPLDVAAFKQKCP